MKSSTAIEKAALRRTVREIDARLTPEARRASDEALFARFLALPQLERPSTVLLYHGMGGEPDTARLIPLLRKAGHAVALPRCRPGHGLEARLVRENCRLVRHPLGMLEPAEDCPLVPNAQIGLALIPGLAFDPRGGRLGRGGGYYDRWLAGFSGPTAALCRQVVLCPAVPREAHDRTVDLVITEERVYGLSPRPAGQGRSPEGPRPAR